MIEYFNLFINKEIKDSDEMKALIRLVKKKQEESGKKQPIFNNSEATDTNSENNDHKTVDICVFVNQKEKGPYATVKLVGKEDDTSDSPFD
tara:strand:+ start:176 stop:448 length:273 start_codon:yes stop_codon:yes gene_type:complete